MKGDQVEWPVDEGHHIMPVIEALLQELEHEARTTRRMLERVPADRLTWKPHDKSMSLGQLALHVAGNTRRHRPDGGAVAFSDS